MNYSLKDKIEVTKEFLHELITSSWRELEAIQQHIANINTTSQLGNEVAKLLKNTCTSYYVLIGCLEALADGKQPEAVPAVEAAPERDKAEIADTTELISVNDEPENILMDTPENTGNFEPFEYFVDFDEPIGEPLSDEDLYRV